MERQKHLKRTFCVACAHHQRALLHRRRAHLGHERRAIRLLGRLAGAVAVAKHCHKSVSVSIVSSVSSSMPEQKHLKRTLPVVACRDARRQHELQVQTQAQAEAQVDRSPPAFASASTAFCHVSCVAFCSAVVCAGV